MTSDIVTLAADATREQIVEAVERGGGVVVEGFVPDDLLRRLNNELDAIAKHWPAGSTFSDDEIMQTAHGSHTKRFCGLVRRSRSFIELLCDVRVAAFADHFLLPNCGSYRLNTSQLTEVGPGAAQQVLHRDDWGWPGGTRGVTLTAQTITALTDFTGENGATIVAVGSHRWSDQDRYPEPSETTSVELSAGSTLLYTGQLIHGAGANVTATKRRRALAMGFVLGWLRTEENHYLSVPQELVCSLPERAQCLLGYRSYEHRTPIGRLGMVDHGDPVYALRKRGLVDDDAHEGAVWPLPSTVRTGPAVDTALWADV
jgi:ectoine hydroxylase-related dioxygenase (phytanoyl-CoA dioxygenase family)